MDYILLSTSISHAIAECYTHEHHDLNFSDHLPLSVLLRAEYLSALQESSNLKVNWRKSVDDGLIPAYAQNVSRSVLLYFHTAFCLSELNNEIIAVSKTLTLTASKYLSITHHR